MSESVMERMRSILKGEVDIASLTDAERKALSRLGQIWDDIRESLSPFDVLLNPSDKKREDIHRAIVEVTLGLYYFIARTCDTVDSLNGIVGSSFKVATQQLELAKSECESAKQQARIANLLAKVAIIISIVSLMVGISTTVYYGTCARRDSDVSTTAIVEAIKNCKCQAN